MNRLTPMGISRLLKRLVGESENPKNEANNESKALLQGPGCCLRSLDLSWNNLHRDQPGAKAMISDLRKLVENPSRCPQELRLNRCSLDPAVCRSIGKGIINRYKDDTSDTTALSLYLCGNGDVGDAGAAALAAAIRGAKTETAIFSTLDLSACNIGDAGAEALALALESHPGCIEKLVLSNNKISNSGAASIARGIVEAKAKIAWLELDNNPGIGNTGASSLAIAVGKGYVCNLSLRSCEVKADGAKAFGECLKTLALLQGSAEISIDLSGNPFGILQKKKRKPEE
jgi:Ran GTPase-activating protein (RanGAP) involved in mRNA processing and transport